MARHTGTNACTSSRARSTAARTRRRLRLVTTNSATTSVRAWVDPPARKNRRRTRPTTTTSVPGDIRRRARRRFVPDDGHGLHPPLALCHLDLVLDHAATRGQHPLLRCAAQRSLQHHDVHVALLALESCLKGKVISTLRRGSDRNSSTGRRGRSSETFGTAVQRSAPARSARVGEVALLVRHPGKQLPRPSHVTGSFVQVGQRIGHSQVVGSRPARGPPCLFEQGDRAGEIAPVGQRAGDDDTAFGHQVGRRRRLAQLLPQLVDSLPPAQRSVAVGQDRMLFG